LSLTNVEQVYPKYTQEENMIQNVKRSWNVQLSVLLLFTVCLGILTGSAGAEAFPQTPAGKRAREIFELINQADRQKWQVYIKENFSEKFLNITPMKDHLDVFSQICDRYGRLEFAYIIKSKNQDQALTVKLKSMETEIWLNMSIRVEKNPPHKTEGHSLRLSWPPRGDAVSDLSLEDQEIASRLKQYAEKLGKAGKFSGAMLLAKNNKILFKGAYGLASIRFNVPNKIDTKFNLGSMNKMFTAVAVAQLVEKGKLSYDDLVGKYLDSSWIQPETARKVKIKHLLTHTSGLGNFFNKKFLDSSRILFREINDWKPLINEDKPKFEPGTDRSYSNSGMFLLGAVIEKVSGIGYYDYILENIYKPAGMKNSGCFDNDRPVPNLAIGYEKIYTHEGFYWRNNIFDHTVKGGPAGGGFSTVEDLFRFARALMEGKLVSKETVELLTSPKPELKSPYYGYGFGIRPLWNYLSVGHSGGFTGISSILQIFRKSGYIYIIMSNHSNGIDLVHLRIDTSLMSRPK